MKLIGEDMLTKVDYAFLIDPPPKTTGKHNADGKKRMGRKIKNCG